MFTSLSVRGNLLLDGYRIGGKTRLRRLDAMIDRFPEPAVRLGQRAGRLSGGEQQMVAIARALWLLILDKPSLGLAPVVTRRVFDLLEELDQVNGSTLSIVEQNALGSRKGVA